MTSRAMVVAKAESIEHSKEMERWLSDRARGRYESSLMCEPYVQGSRIAAQIIFNRFLKVWFEDKQDAVLFKLTWGGV